MNKNQTRIEIRNLQAIKKDAEQVLSRINERINQLQGATAMDKCKECGMSNGHRALCGYEDNLGNPNVHRLQDIVNEIKTDSKNVNHYMSLLSKEDQKEVLRLLNQQVSINAMNWIKKQL